MGVFEVVSVDVPVKRYEELIKKETEYELLKKGLANAIFVSDFERLKELFANKKEAGEK